MKPLTLTTQRGYDIAYIHQPGSSPGVMFCCGYRSDLSSTKATAIADWCAANGVAFTRFDYNGHGATQTDFKEFTIGGAIADALDVLDEVTQGPMVIVGSSMGAWVALHVALERKDRIKGLLTVAAAPDFTERLMFPRFTPEQRRELDEEGLIWAHSDYANNDYPITRNFIHEARNHLLLDDVIGLTIPAHLMHGQQDIDVPWETSLHLGAKLLSDDVITTFIKDGDHRLNRPADLAILTSGIGRMLGILS